MITLKLGKVNAALRLAFRATGYEAWLSQSLVTIKKNATIQKASMRSNSLAIMALLSP